MDLPSGKTISNNDLRDLIDYWVLATFRHDLHLADTEDIIYDDYSIEHGSGKYNDADVAFILEAVEDTAIDLIVALKESFSSLHTRIVLTKYPEEGG